MCIRDSIVTEEELWNKHDGHAPAGKVVINDRIADNMLQQICLLYTSDAADERSSVDLGGRRIIKKKKQRKHTRALTLLQRQR